MENFLNGITLNQHTISLSLILIVIGQYLKELPYVSKWMIPWILLIISIVINFIFYKITFQTLFEAILATLISTFGYDLYTQTKKGIRSLRG